MAFLSTALMVTIISILEISSRVFLTLAVYYDCKSKRISNKIMWTLLTAIFGWIPAVVYACVRVSAKKETVICKTCGATLPQGSKYCPRCNAESTYDEHGKNAKVSKTFIILFAVVAFVSTIMFSVLFIGIANDGYENFLNKIDQYDEFDDFEYDDEFETVYYDKNGTAYDDIDDVCYFDENNNVYKFSEDDFCYKDLKGNLYPSLKCFIDENGWFYYDADDSLVFDGQTAKYKNKDGKTYIPAMGVYWNADGTINSAL